MVGVGVPTREEMQEIEISSRLYNEDGARYMTASILHNVDVDPQLSNVTFILARKRLITVRYDEPRSFPLYAARACKAHPEPGTGETVLLGLLDTIIDRAADILEKVGAEIDHISTWVFQRHISRPRRQKNYMAMLRSVGLKGDILSKSRESLLTIGRMVLFLSAEIEGQRVAKDVRTQLRSMSRDVQSLTDHASYLGSKVTFLLDAILGMVSIEQNDIIKLFSVVSVVLMPPTLIASTYGMNFNWMPELHWEFGYPYALALMFVSAILPYLLFRWRGWL
jgi:magnesium transporter